jgi:hypothetical protein
MRRWTNFGKRSYKQGKKYLQKGTQQCCHTRVIGPLVNPNLVPQPLWLCRRVNRLSGHGPANPIAPRFQTHRSSEVTRDLESPSTSPVGKPQIPPQKMRRIEGMKVINICLTGTF